MMFDPEHNLGDYLRQVREDGESIVVQDGGSLIAELRPTLRTVRGAEFLARLESLPRLGPEEAEAFGADIDAAREELNAIPVADPWAAVDQRPRQ